MPAQAMVEKPKTHREPEIEYPSSDGKPMAESDTARDLMFDIIDTLKHHFASDPNVYVSGDILLYYEEGNPRKCVAPDVLVTMGIPAVRRDIYKLWEEGKPPDFVLEVASKTTWQTDHVRKPILYHSLGISEYFLFDWTGGWLPHGPLAGFRLDGRNYQPIEPTDRGRLLARSLNLFLEARDGWLYLYDPATGERLLTSPERAEREKARAEREKIRAEREKIRAERFACKLRELGFDPAELVPEES